MEKFRQTGRLVPYTGMVAKAIPRLQSWFEREQQKVQRRLESAKSGQRPRGRGPELSAQTIHYESSNRIQAIHCGGIGPIHQLAQKVGLVNAIDSHLHILERHRPYRESDHILNIAYNLLCGGNVLDDIEIRRKDPAFLDALGARTIPDPTTAGDFCRRFDDVKINKLMDIVNDVRVGVWQKQPKEFFEQTARIDADGYDIYQTSCPDQERVLFVRRMGVDWGCVRLARIKSASFS
jgi:hypothetical protein